MKVINFRLAVRLFLATGAVVSFLVAGPVQAQQVVGSDTMQVSATVRHGAPRCATVRHGAPRCATVRHGAWSMQCDGQ